MSKPGGRGRAERFFYLQSLRSGRGPPAIVPKNDTTETLSPGSLGTAERSQLPQPPRGRGRGHMLELLKKRSLETAPFPSPPNQPRPAPPPIDTTETLSPGPLRTAERSQLPQPPRGRGRGHMLELLKKCSLETAPFPSPPNQPKPAPPPIDSVAGSNIPENKTSPGIEKKNDVSSEPLKVKEQFQLDVTEEIPDSVAGSNIPENITCAGIEKKNDVSSEPLKVKEQFQLDVTEEIPDSVAGSNIPEDKTCTGIDKKNDVSSEPLKVKEQFQLDVTEEIPDELEKKLHWFYQPTKTAITMDYLNRMKKESIHDTDSLINNLTPIRSQIFRYTIEMGKIKLLLDDNLTEEALKILSDILQEKQTLTGLNCEEDLIHSFIYWFNIINSYIQHTKKHPVTVSAVLETTSKEWADTYIKSAFYQLFSRTGCELALMSLPTLRSDLERPARNIEDLELLFLRARVLGRLRYLDQWPESRWQEEQDIVFHILRYLVCQDTNYSVRIRLYLAEFLRLRAYRLFVQHNEVNVEASSIGIQITDMFEKSRELLRYLEAKLKEINSVEGIAWLAEQWLKSPSKEWEDGHDEVANELLKYGMMRNELCPYIHRICALYFETQSESLNRLTASHHQQQGLAVRRKREAMKDTEMSELHEQAANHLELAATRGSNKAQAELVGLKYRLKKKIEMSELQVLPDPDIHMASYLVLCQHKHKEAQECIMALLNEKDEYPPLLPSRNMRLNASDIEVKVVNDMKQPLGMD